MWRAHTRLSTREGRRYRPVVCVTREALLSALALRIRSEGYRVTREEIRSLLALGCTRESIDATFAGLPESEAREHARALLKTVR